MTELIDRRGGQVPLSAPRNTLRNESFFIIFLIQIELKKTKDLKNKKHVFYRNLEMLDKKRI